MILKFWILPTGLLPDKLKMPREATFLKSFIVSQYQHMDNVWRLSSFRPVKTSANSHSKTSQLCGIQYNRMAVFI